MSATRIERRACFGGWQEVWRVPSEALGGDTPVGVYLPPQAATERCPVVVWLSGLTCTEQNFVTKAGAQRYAAERGLILVVPDTSPRGADVPDAEGYDLGQGASFYLDATREPWAGRYRMERWIVHELSAWVEASFPASGARSILGHSMGGHGALTLALRNPGRFRAASAFSPIVAPSRVPWGQKAFAAYLGEDRAAWAAHDAEQLVLAGAAPDLPLLVDQGLADEFLERQLQPEHLEAACAARGRPLTLRRHAGYDHSYYFIATFIGEHLAWHDRHLRG